MYGLPYFASPDDALGYRDYLGSELSEREGLADDFVAIVREVIDTAAGAKVLDVGAGPGLFVAACISAGFRAEGLEISPDVAALAARTKMVPVRATSVEEYLSAVPSDAGGAVDVVTLFDVVEHLESPADVLQRIRERILAMDGVLFLSTPQFAGDLYYRQTSRYVQFKRDHLWHFSSAGLQRLLADSGFADWTIVTGDRLASCCPFLSAAFRDKYSKRREHLFAFAGTDIGINVT